MKYVLREITPLDKRHLFYTSYYPHSPNDFPLHFHEDFEITMTLNVSGKRIIGNRADDFDDNCLVLTGPNVLHCFKRDPECMDRPCELMVVQFRKDFHISPLFDTDEFAPIRSMLEKAGTGIIFSENTARKITPKMRVLHTLTGFSRAMALFEILYDLASSENQFVLPAHDVRSRSGELMQKSHRVNKILNFIELNYRNRITLDDIGMLVGMPASSVSRFFKAKTKQNIWQYLTNYRIDRAAQMIVETSRSISEICYECGFNNISNFNRAFRERMKTSPSQHRQSFDTSRVENDNGVKIITTKPAS